MITPGLLNLTALRWQPFLYSINFVGLDFTGSTKAMQVRVSPDALGSPLVDLTNQTAGTQGLSVSVVTTLGIPTSTVLIQINETTIEGLVPFAVTDGVPNRRPDADLILYYDLVITGGGLPKTRWAEGSLTIKPGVTQ